jgi:hypothetical protein
MEIENTGDSDSQNVAARVFGPAWLNVENKSDRTESFTDLRASGETSIPKRASWTFTAPNLEENREATYTIYSKLFFDYNTSAETEFKLVSGQRFREQEYSRKEASVQNSAGPIQLDVRGTTPKIYYEDESNSINSEICIVVENQGSGIAFTENTEQDGREYNELSQTNKDTVDLTISARGAVKFRKASSSSGEFQRTKTVPDVELINGNEAYQCFTMDATGITNDETTVNIDLEADYNYKVEEDTSLTVEGRRN